jgi:hypothetical protein
MVPGVGVAPTSLRLRRSAFTGLASQANWCGRRGSHPGLHVGNVARCSYATSAWWGMDGIEPLATQGPDLQLGERTSASLLAFPELVAGRGVAPRSDEAYETSWILTDLPAAIGGA